MHEKVFVNGTFDLLHPGHIALLEYAKSRSIHLLVAIDSDTRVSQLKGSNRPINNQDTRKLLLHSLKFVDAVKIFYTDDQLRAIAKIYQPDLMLVGSDYKDKNVIGSKYAKQLEFFERDSRFSTTKIIQSIVDR